MYNIAYMIIYNIILFSTQADGHTYFIKSFDQSYYTYSNIQKRR